jgi:hypothetical protein
MARKSSINQTARVLTVEELEVLRQKGDVSVTWKPNLPQHKVLISLADEIFFAGGKYGGKSVGGRYWLVSGNPHLPSVDKNGNAIKTNQSYMWDPNFIGVVLRKNVQDLREWTEKSKRAYEPYGVHFVGNPDEFRHDCGARIYMGHFQDRDSWERFQGGNVIRFLVEEAGQFADLRTYELFVSSCRSPFELMRAQVLLTANPGGPGQPWLYDRFLEPKDPKTGELLINPKTNKPYQPEEEIEEILEHPFIPGQFLTKTRVWIPSLITDNEYAMRDGTYLANLAGMQDEKMRKAYLYGDWKAFKGTYLSIKPEQHFITVEPSINAWDKRYYSLDIGFNHEAAISEAIHLQTDQLYFSREEVGAGIDPVQLGINAARFMKPALLNLGYVPLFISHDAFNMKIGGITEVELLQKGFERVLGKGNVHVPNQYLQEMEQRAIQNADIWTPAIAAEFESRILKSLTKGIVIKKAPKGTAVSWKYFSSMFRTETYKLDALHPLDWNVAISVAAQEGLEKFNLYISNFTDTTEVLPKLLFFKPGVPRLIEALPKLIHSDENPDMPDKRHFKGRDSVDSALYLVTSVRDEPITEMPLQARTTWAVETLKKYYPWLANDLDAQRKIIADIEAKNKPSTSPIRPTIRIGPR